MNSIKLRVNNLNYIDTSPVIMKGGKVKLKVGKLYARVLKGKILVKLLKQHMDNISQVQKIQPDYLKNKQKFDALFKVVIEQNVTNLEYNILKGLPELPFSKKNRNYYYEFLNRLKRIRRND